MVHVSIEFTGTVWTRLYAVISATKAVSLSVACSSWYLGSFWTRSTAVVAKSQAYTLTEGKRSIRGKAVLPAPHPSSNTTLADSKRGNSVLNQCLSLKNDAP